MTDTVNGTRTMKARAFAGPGSDLDAAAKLLHFAVHHIHTDAATGDLRHRLGGGESGRQHELRNLLIGQRRTFRHQAALHRLGPDRLHVDAGAIVADLDDHVSPFPGQTQVDAPGGRLAEVGPKLLRLDTVVDRVAEHVFQRRHHALEQAAVQLALRVVGMKLHFFAELTGNLTNDSDAAGATGG